MYHLNMYREVSEEDLSTLHTKGDFSNDLYDMLYVGSNNSRSMQIEYVR